MVAGKLPNMRAPPLIMDPGRLARTDYANVTRGACLRSPDRGRMGARIRRYGPRQDVPLAVTAPLWAAARSRATVADTCGSTRSARRIFPAPVAAVSGHRPGWRPQGNNPADRGR